MSKENLSFRSSETRNANMKQLLSAVFILIISTKLMSIDMMYTAHASPLISKGNNKCPIIVNNCVCEDANNGGFNIFCPNRQYHQVFIYYKEPQEMFLTCNTRGIDGRTLYSTDIIYGLKNLTVSQIDLLQLKKLY